MAQTLMASVSISVTLGNNPAVSIQAKGEDGKTYAFSGINKQGTKVLNEILEAVRIGYPIAGSIRVTTRGSNITAT